MTILAAFILLLVAILGVLLTLLTLPGTWFILGAALLLHLLWGEPPLLNTWNLIICAGLALLAEIAEFALSAVGAARAGGGRSGAIGSILGGFLGAILGTLFVPIPVIGTIAGGVLGAGLGAVALERGIAQRSWSQAARIGKGAATGRLLSVLVKTALAAAIGVSLIIDSLFP